MTYAPTTTQKLVNRSPWCATVYVTAGIIMIEVRRVPPRTIRIANVPNSNTPITPYPNTTVPSDEWISRGESPSGVNRA